MRETTFIEIISALLNYFIQQYLNKSGKAKTGYTYSYIHIHRQINRHTKIHLYLDTRIPRQLHTRCLLYKKVVTTFQQKVDWEIKTEKALRHILDLFFFKE